MDEFQDGAPGYYTGEFKVLKDGPIHTVEDMKGHVAASPGAGSALDIAIRAMMKKHGLEDKRDYTIVEAALPNLKSMLLSKKVDLAAAGTTAITDPELQAQTRNLFTQVEAVGRTEMIMLAARERLPREEPCRGRRFPRRCAARTALLFRPGQSQGSGRDCRAIHQAAGGAARSVALHHARLLPRSERRAGCDRAAEQRRSAQAARLPQDRRSTSRATSISAMCARPLRG